MCESGGRRASSRAAHAERTGGVGGLLCFDWWGGFFSLVRLHGMGVGVDGLGGTGGDVSAGGWKVMGGYLSWARARRGRTK